MADDEGGAGRVLAGVLQPGFRKVLAPRVHESGRIFRSIDGLEGIFETKGSGASPEMLRTEMGVMYGFDLGPVLATQLAELDAVSVAVTTAGANSNAATTFSFPTLPSGGPASRHRIQSAVVSVGGTVANFEAAELLAQPFGDPTQVRIAHVVAADLSTSTLASTVRLEVSDLWGRRDVDYVFRVRSGAGGASTAALNLLVMMTPQGIAVPK